MCREECAIRLSSALTLLFLAAAAPTRAEPQPAPTVSGYYISGSGERIALTHVIALRMDGAEGVRPASVRVLLTDRPVPISAIERVLAPAILDMGLHGEVRGLLLEFDPADRTRLSVDRLDPGDQAIGFLLEDPPRGTTFWTSLSGDRSHVAGTFAPREHLNAAFRFDTMVDYDPVQRTLTGPAARDSEYVRIYLAQSDAWLRGDEAALRRLSTRASVGRHLAIPASAIPGARALVAEVAIATRAGRVLVRGRTAEIVAGTHMIETLELEDGEWKVAD